MKNAVNKLSRFSTSLFSAFGLDLRWFWIAKWDPKSHFGRQMTDLGRLGVHRGEPGGMRTAPSRATTLSIANTKLSKTPCILTDAADSMRGAHPTAPDVSAKHQEQIAMLSAAINAFCSFGDCSQTPCSTHSQIKPKVVLNLWKIEPGTAKIQPDSSLQH